jgi:hypothetical protein
MTTEGKPLNYDKLSESQKKSAYFSLQNSYDPMVYENTVGNYFKILGMLFLFYVVMMLHWFGNYSLGIHFSEICTIYNAIIFCTAIITIGCMLCYGSTVNKKKSTHEYYAEKISEARIKQQEKENRDN